MKSPYADPNDDEEDPTSPYAPSSSPEGLDEGGAADADGAAYSGDPSLQTAGNADWLTTAPEARGAAPFSTTPENAAPRSDAQIGKQDLPNIGQGPSEASQAAGGALTRSPRYDERDRLDKKIEKYNNPGFWGNLGRTALAMQSPGAYNALVGGQGAALQKQRADLVQEIQYDENRQGLQPQGKPFAVQDSYGPGWHLVQMNRLGQPQNMGPTVAPTANAEVRAAGSLAYAKAKGAAMEKGRIDGQGRLIYTDPRTGESTVSQIPGRPAQGNVTDADNPAAQSPYSPPTASTTPIFPVPGAAAATKEDEFSHIETDDAGNLTGITRSGKTKFLGKGGKSAPPRPAPESPNDKRASMGGEAAMQAFLRDPTSDPGAKNPQEAYARGYEAAGGTTKQLPGSFSVQHPKGEEKPFRNKTTGTTDTFVSDGKKWVKKASAPTGLARSH